MTTAASPEVAKRYEILVNTLQALRDVYGMDPEKLAQQALRTLDLRTRTKRASDEDIIRRVVARHSDKEYPEVRVLVSPTAADALPRIISRIHQLGCVGHTFGIQSDCDPGEEGKLGGWDGDGADSIIRLTVATPDGSIQEIDLATGEAK